MMPGRAPFTSAAEVQAIGRMLETLNGVADRYGENEDDTPVYTHSGRIVLTDVNGECTAVLEATEGVWVLRHVNE